MKVQLHATDLAINWIGKICALALLGSLVAMVANALTVKDPELYKYALLVMAVSATGMGSLGGYIGGFHAGASSMLPIPRTPTGTFKE